MPKWRNFTQKVKKKPYDGPRPGDRTFYDGVTGLYEPGYVVEYWRCIPGTTTYEDRQYYIRRGEQQYLAGMQYSFYPRNGIHGHFEFSSEPFW